MDLPVKVIEIPSRVSFRDIRRQLNEEEHKLLLAFSVYREPVSLEAVQAIVEFTTKVSKAQVQAMLKMLVTQHLLQHTGEGYYLLHPIVASYARRHFVENDKQANQQASREAHTRAAHYYRQQAARRLQNRRSRRTQPMPRWRRALEQVAPCTSCLRILTVVEFPALAKGTAVLPAD